MLLGYVGFASFRFMPSVDHEHSPAEFQKDPKTKLDGSIKMFNTGVSSLSNSTSSLERAVTELNDLAQHTAPNPFDSKIQNPFESKIDKIDPPVVTPVVPSPSTGNTKYWLIIGIPTVPRRNDIDYLTTTLQTLLEQLPADKADPFFGKVGVFVMNNKPGDHKVYDRVKEYYKTGEGAGGRAAYLHFLDNPGVVKDPAPHLPDPDDLHNPTNRPGRGVRKQTCDLVTLIEMARDISDYYLFMEDDFAVCPHFTRALHYVIEKANTVQPDWLSLRVSYGMNGIAMKSSDIPMLSAYLREHTARLPPDLLWQEFVAGNNPEAKKSIGRRKIMVYKYNLLDHIGTISSFAIRPNRPKWPGCYDSMADVWSLQKIETFDARQCPSDDMSPCNFNTPRPAWAGKDNLIKFHK
ncbi:hypothetical protein CYMTET_27790 [Cymbomonas tetramitiformis]|uniref:MGAT4 conserved region domain-containing protein n=1 Tax=Cymbomonas tetramitiformis TaxID=36881 RepID=A0AAE0FP66_9CHLO|nr:hypothetical protein CYMTET_27790 [Cymbomonas tetramitiformis]